MSNEYDPKYSAGEQPCKKFLPDEMEMRWWGVASHYCPICGGSRVFCETCKRDHHSMGWQTCTESRPKGDV